METTSYSAAGSASSSPRAPLRALLVEDSPDDALLVLRELQRGGYEPTWERVDTADDTTAALQRQDWDIVLCDYVLPRFSGLAALQLIREGNPDLPVIIVSGEIGEDVAVAAMQAGASDFVMKGRLARLLPAIDRERREAVNRRTRRQAEEALRISELRYRIVSELSFDYAYALRVAADGTVTPEWMTAGFGHITGFTIDELAASGDLLQIVHPDDQGFARERRTRLLAGQLDVSDVRIVTKSGQVRWLCERGLPEWDETQQHVVRIYGAAKDITDRKEAEQQITELYRAQEEETEVAAALAQVGQEMISSLDTPVILERLCRITQQVLECDASHTFLANGPSGAYVAVAAHGYPAEQRDMLRVIQFPPEMFAAAIGQLDQDSCKQFNLGESPMAPVRAFAARFDVATTMYVALRVGGKIVGLHAGCYRDPGRNFSPRQRRIVAGIGQLASFALANARLVEELECANKLRSEFVANVSHELRTPVNIVTGYTDLLIEGAFGPLTAEQTDVLQHANRTAIHLGGLINATLDVGRLDAGRMALNVTTVDVAELLTTLVQNTQGWDSKPEVRCSSNVAAGLPLIRSDADKLSGVLKNVIDNAIKFTARGSIAVAAEASGRGVRITVTDTGIGISPEQRAVIFEPFRQADGSMTRVHGGLGLGLYVAHRLIEMLRGTISVSSGMGQGSSFEITVPTLGDVH